MNDAVRPASTTADPKNDAPPSPGGDLDTDAREVFELEETGFNEVPKKWRRFYRYWNGPGDQLGPNEIVCPVCKVVIRSRREIRPGDRLYCMPCMSRLLVVLGDDGALTTEVLY